MEPLNVRAIPASRALGAPRVLTAAVAAICAAVAACGAVVRTVPVGPHASSAAPPAIVEEPPPLNKVETMSRDPGKPCAWLDGRWDWADRTWEWIPGMWVLPPKACHFAPPEAVWVPSAGRGLLFYLSGRWYPDSGGSACEMARPCGR